METLPDELKNEVLKYLTADELSRSREINREFRDLAEDEYLWKDQVNRKYGQIPQICDSWRLTYRDFPKLRPVETIVVTYDSNMFDAVDVYPIDEFTNLERLYPMIVQDIFDTLMDGLGDIPFEAETDFNPYTLNLNDQDDVFMLDNYLFELKTRILNRIRHGGRIEGIDWSITIARVNPKYLNESSR